MAAATAAGPAIAGQLAVRLKSANPVLEGGSASHVYATGWSQTGVFWRDFLHGGHHERNIDSAGRAGSTDTSSPWPPRLPRDARDAVLVQLFSETEVIGLLRGPARVDDDSDDPRFRGYEVPGSFHLWHEPARLAELHPDGQHNREPWWVIVHAILDGMHHWVVNGHPMYRAPKVTRDPSAPDGVAHDEHGNALGGLRTPWLDVPVARYDVRCSCSIVVGAKTPLSAPPAYDRFVAAVGDMVAAGFLLPADRAAMVLNS